MRRNFGELPTLPGAGSGSGEAAPASESSLPAAVGRDWSTNTQGADNSSTIVSPRGEWPETLVDGTTAHHGLPQDAAGRIDTSSWRDVSAVAPDALTALKAEYSSLEAEYKASWAKAARLEEALTDAAKNIQSLRDTNGDLRAEVARRGNLLDEAKAEAADREVAAPTRHGLRGGEHWEYGPRHERTSYEQESRVARLQAEVDRRDMMIDELAAAVGDAKREAAALRQQLLEQAPVAGPSQDVASRITSLETDLAKSAALIRGLTSRVHSAEREVVALNKQLRDRASAARPSDGGALHARYEREVETSRALRKQVQELNKQLCRATHEATTWKAALERTYRELHAHMALAAKKEESGPGL